MSEQEKQPSHRYELGKTIKYKSGNGEIFEMWIESYNRAKDFYTLRGIVRGENRDIRVPRNMMDEKIVSPEEENLKYPVGAWVNIYRNVYDTNGKKTGEKKMARGFVNGIAKGDGRYVILCTTSSDEQEAILVTEKTLDELNPKGGRKLTDATLQVKTTRTTLQGGFDGSKK